MIYQCPGQDKRNIKAEDLTCAVCGYTLEVFSDEIKARCPRCKNYACRARKPSCADWCKFAKKCIG